MAARKQPGKRYFTVSEANATLPYVRAVVRDVTELAAQLRERHERLVRLRPGESGGMTPLVAYLLLFVAVGAGFILVHLVAGKFLRPSKMDAEKGTIYECGEPTIGSAWVQFDLRFYVVALLFVIFDVEVAFFFPWAEVFGKANAIRLTESEATGQAREIYERDLKDLVPAQPPSRLSPGGTEFEMN